MKVQLTTTEANDIVVIYESKSTKQPDHDVPEINASQSARVALYLCAN